MTTRPIAELLSDPDPAFACYASEDPMKIEAAHDGDCLYKELEIFPIEQWPLRSEQMVESWAENDYDDRALSHARSIKFI